MLNSQLMKLSLHTPLTERSIFCYELNRLQSQTIEPDPAQLLGQQISEGSLPAGIYLFTQKRSGNPLNQEEWLEMAIEQQKDGLWERYKPGNLLYVRFLFEDEANVTQVFRPLL